MTIDTTKMQRAASAKHYQRVAGTGAHENMTSDMDIAPILSNPSGYLNTLANLSPGAEYFASNSILASLGYVVINQFLWAYRKEHAKDKPAQKTIDDFNDEYADMFAKDVDKAMTRDNGLSKLPEFDAIPLAPVYMWMFYMQRGNAAYSTKYPPRMPYEVLHEMQTQDRSAEIQDELRKLDNARIAASPARFALMAEKNKAAKVLEEFVLKQHRAEMDHIVKSLACLVPDELTDGHWASIPLFVQYKLLFFVYKQAVKTVAKMTEAYKRDDNKFNEAIELVDTIHLELEAAARTPEVKLAFESGRLDERHDICVKADTSEPVSAAPKAQHIPKNCSQVTVVKAEAKPIDQPISTQAPDKLNDELTTDEKKTLAAIIAAQPRATLKLKH